MPSTYANDLRLEIIATGEQSGTWGDTTNDNLALIADALSYGAEDLSSDANATITMADGASDAVRSLYLKVTSSVSLTATRTITLAPNTVSKVWIIENATTGSQSITIKQGTGNTVTVANGAVKAVYSDGAGAGAAVNDALVDLDLTGISTIAALTIGGDGATVTGIKDEDDMASNSAVKLATQQSIKAYIDSTVTSQDLDITTDSGSIDIDLDSESLTLAGGTGLDSSASSTTVTFAIDATVATLAGSQTLTNKTISGANNTISAYAGDSSLVTTGALDSGSITSGFGNINIGASTFTGALVGNVTGNVSGTAATVTGAAQAAITSLGTLTTLTVDDITINANTISSGGASTLAITPTAGQAITFDGTVTLDAGVIAGATSITSTAFVGALTGNASTATALETARTIGGVSFNGTAAIVPATITVADTTDTTSFVGLWESATGDLAPKTDAAITYNAGTGALTATTFVGALTGNASGTSATVTGATQAAITTAANLVTVGALDSGSISSGFGNINNGASTITGGAASFATISGSTSLALATGATVTGIDNGTLGSSATLLATQGAIRTAIDAAVATADTLSEVLALGNTTSGTDISVSASDDITFADNAKAIFGASSDLQIYHSGTQSYITDGGTGDLNIQGNNLVLEDPSGNNYLFATSGGAVSLFHNAASKLATTATGIDVTGTVTATGTSVFASLDISGDIDVDGTTNLDVVDIDGAVDMASTLQVDGAATFSSTVNGMTIKASASGDRFGCIAEVASNGVMEVGRYIDFHATDGDTSDYGARLDFDGSTLIIASATSFTGAITANAGVVVDNITIDGTEIDLSSGDLTLDVAGDIILDADGADVIFKDGGTEFGRISKGGGSDLVITASIADKDIFLTGTDGTTAITALTLDMSAAGAATFNGAVTVGGNFAVQGADVDVTANIRHAGDTDTYYGFHGENLYRVTTGGTERFEVSDSGIIINDSGADADFRVESDTNTHMLFVDAGNDAVGIGTSSAGSFTIGDLVVGDGVGARGITIYNAADNEGIIRFADGTSGNEQYRGQIKYNHAEDSLNFHTTAASSSAENLKLSSTEAVFNEGGVDADFRVESDGNANMLFVDGGNDRVGIGTTPSYTFDILAASAVAMVRTADTSSPTLGLFVNSGSNGVGTISVDDGGHMTFDTGATGAGQAERLRIDSAGTSTFTGTIQGDVGTAASLILNSTDDTPYMRLDESDAAYFTIGESSIVGGGGAGFYDFYAATGRGLRFFTAGGEAARIDTSQNVLVGTTSNSVYNDASGTGIALNAGEIQIAGTGTPLYANRQGSDGNIADFRKDGATVGSIGTNGGRPYFVNNVDGGIHLATDGYGRALVLPSNESGAPEDNLHYLGSSSYRWRDLYLSGGAYIGGTGAANYLDDYEEGTWTPTVVTGYASVSSVSATYTKVGDKVTVWAYVNSLVTGNSSDVSIGGLPFTSKTNQWAVGALETSAAGTGVMRIISASTQMVAYRSGSSLDALIGTDGASHLIFSITYSV